MMFLDYDIRVRGVTKRIFILDPDNQQNPQLFQSEETVKLKFFTRNIIRRCVLSPDSDQDPLLLPEIRSPAFWRWIDIPIAWFLEDQESVKRREIEALTRLGIPEEIRLIIVKRVSSEAMKMIKDRRETGGGISMEIVVGIAAVKFESLDREEYEEELRREYEEAVRMEFEEAERREFEEDSRRAELESTEFDAKTIPATKSSIEALVKVRVDDVETMTKCMVCLEEIKVNTIAIGMPCSHSYHQQCIVRWLQNSHFCPICRFQMPPQLQ